MYKFIILRAYRYRTLPSPFTVGRRGESGCCGQAGDGRKRPSLRKNHTRKRGGAAASSISDCASTGPLASKRSRARIDKHLHTFRSPWSCSSGPWGRVRPGDIFGVA